MNKLFVMIFSLCSLPAMSQTIECQIMKEQILSEIRQQQSQRAQSQIQQNQGTLLNPSMNNIYGLAEQRGKMIGGGIAAVGNALAGQPVTLQDRIDVYKQKCE